MENTQAQCVLVTILTRYLVQLGLPLRTGARMGEASGIFDFGHLGAEGRNQGDALFPALSECLTWIENTLCHTAWLLFPAHSRACSYSYGSGPAVRPQTGDKGMSPIAPTRPWRDEGEGPSAAKVKLCGVWHSDDEPVVGDTGKCKLIVSLGCGAGIFFSVYLISLVRLVMTARKRQTNL